MVFLRAVGKFSTHNPGECHGKCDSGGFEKGFRVKGLGFRVIQPPPVRVAGRNSTPPLCSSLCTTMRGLV